MNHPRIKRKRIAGAGKNASLRKRRKPKAV